MCPCVSVGVGLLVSETREKVNVMVPEVDGETTERVGDGVCVLVRVKVGSLESVRLYVAVAVRVLLRVTLGTVSEGVDVELIVGAEVEVFVRSRVRVGVIDKVRVLVPAPVID